MTCPSCGGADRSPLTPGYWRCTSLVTTRHVGYVPDLNMPLDAPHSYGATPVASTTSKPCGHQYQEAPMAGGAVPQCGCGMFAIGACGQCGSHVCGDHSKTRGGFRCDPCFFQWLRDEDHALALKMYKATQERLAREELERQRVSSLPEMSFADLVLFAKGELADGLRSRSRTGTGEEFARAALEAGIKPIQYGTRDKSLFRGYGHHRGFGIRHLSKSTSEDFDRPNYTSERAYLRADGSVELVHTGYHSKTWTEVIAEPSDVHGFSLFTDVVQSAR